MKKVKVNPEKIVIEKIQLYKSVVIIPKDDLELISRVKGYSFSISQKAGVNFENNLVRYQIEVHFQAKDGKNNPLEIKGEFGSEFVFQIDNFKELAIKESDQFVLDSALDKTLLSIAYSTFRGMILQETRTTIVGGVILPVINPSTLTSVDRN